MILSCSTSSSYKLEGKSLVEGMEMILELEKEWPNSYLHYNDIESSKEMEEHLYFESSKIVQ